MNTLSAIAQRRSIRKFKGITIPEETLNTILQAGIQAPSGKNRQPWRFIVIQGDRRAEMVKVIRSTIDLFKQNDWDYGSAEWTADVMEQAPVTVFIINPFGKSPLDPHSVDDVFQDLVDIQSIGAAIQNMLLAAVDLGLGSLWIGDVLFAYADFSQWLGESGALIAAVSFGYPDEAPDARPRKSFTDVVRYL